LIHFYYFRYLPIRNNFEVLEKEHKVIKDSLLPLISKIPTEKRQGKEPAVQLPYDLKYSVKEFFTGNSAELSTRGIEVLNNLFTAVKSLPFDSLTILLKSGGDLQVNRALKIKAYLVSLGLDEKRVFARVSKSGEKDFVIIRVK